MGTLNVCYTLVLIRLGFDGFMPTLTYHVAGISDKSSRPFHDSHAFCAVTISYLKEYRYLTGTSVRYIAQFRLNQNEKQNGRKGMHGEGLMYP